MRRLAALGLCVAIAGITPAIAAEPKDADNTGQNVRDRGDHTTTPMDQGGSEGDRTITAEIRSISSGCALIHAREPPRNHSHRPQNQHTLRKMKGASVMRTSPLRLQLTVPQQYSVEVSPGRAVSLEVDTAPGKTFTGQVRYVSPALQTDSRTMIVARISATRTRSWFVTSESLTTNVRERLFLSTLVIRDSSRKRSPA